MLDLYALICITPCKATLENLIQLVETDNERRHQAVANGGDDPGRTIRSTNVGIAPVPGASQSLTLIPATACGLRIL